MDEEAARYRAVRRCVTCHERLTDRQVWDSNGVCPHCGEVTGRYYCDTYTTSERRDSSPELQAFETAVRRNLEGHGIRLVSLTLSTIRDLPAWEARAETRNTWGEWRKFKLTFERNADDSYSAPKSLASSIAEALRSRAPSAPSAPPAPAALAAPVEADPVEAPVHGTFINDLRLLLADLGISAMWKAGLTRVRRLLTVGVRLR